MLKIYVLTNVDFIGILKNTCSVYYILHSMLHKPNCKTRWWVLFVVLIEKDLSSFHSVVSKIWMCCVSSCFYGRLCLFILFVLQKKNPVYALYLKRWRGYNFSHLNKLYILSVHTYVKYVQWNGRFFFIQAKNTVQVHRIKCETGIDLPL